MNKCQLVLQGFYSRSPLPTLADFQPRSYEQVVHAARALDAYRYAARYVNALALQANHLHVKRCVSRLAHCSGHVRGYQQHIGNGKYLRAHASLVSQDGNAKRSLAGFGGIQHKLVNNAIIQKIIRHQQSKPLHQLKQKDMS